MALNPGERAAEFEIEALTGGKKNLQGLLRDGGGILLFFKIECPTCRLAMPFIERVYQRLKRLPIGFLAVGRNTTEEIEQFARDFKLTMPFGKESEPYTASNAYQVTNVPSLFLIDSQGVIVRSQVGHSKDGFEKVLQDAAKLVGAEKLDPIFTAADASVKAMQPG